MINDGRRNERRSSTCLKHLAYAKSSQFLGNADPHHTFPGVYGLDRQCQELSTILNTLNTRDPDIQTRRFGIAICNFLIFMYIFFDIGDFR